jgi:hypothetical protein
MYLKKLEFLKNLDMLDIVHPERGDLWMELSAVSDQRSANSLILLL